MDVLRAEVLAVLEVVPDEVLGERPVGAVAAHGGLPHVPVGVDHARQHDAARGVDLPGALGDLEPRPDLGDAVAGDEHVGVREHRCAASTVSTVPPRRTTGPDSWSLRRPPGGSDAPDDRPHCGQAVLGAAIGRGVKDHVPGPGQEVAMPREGTGPDFIEALARGLDVIAAFRPGSRRCR